jgi:hypothetical protein
MVLASSKRAISLPWVQPPKFASEPGLLMGKPDKKHKLELKEAEKQKYKRFAKAARKVGLLVSKDAYFRRIGRRERRVANQLT